jgi:citrate lyase beta subunit
MSEIGVRISAATPEADLSAAVWPGVTSITHPHVESAQQIQEADALIARLERLRGIRPGQVRIQGLIESTLGITRAEGIAGASPRVDALGVGPAITLELGEDSLLYARAECELHARANGVVLVDPLAPHD